jgi:hypothetical protein
MRPIADLLRLGGREGGLEVYVQHPSLQMAAGLEKPSADRAIRMNPKTCFGFHGA